MLKAKNHTSGFIAFIRFYQIVSAANNWSGDD